MNTERIYEAGFCIQQWNPNPEAADEWRFRDEYFRTRRGEVVPVIDCIYYVAPLATVKGVANVATA